MVACSRWLRKRILPRVLIDDLVEWLNASQNDASYPTVVELVDFSREFDGKVTTPSLSIGTTFRSSFNSLFPAIRGLADKPYFAQSFNVYYLTNVGWLHYVRQCHCGKWFGDLRADAKSCSVKCHQAACERSQQASPGFKEENRVYQQWHRAKRAKKTNKTSAQFMTLSEAARREICKRR